MLAPKVKDQGDGMWTFVARNCLDGSVQIKGIDFNCSYSPTANTVTVRLLLSYTSSKRLILGLLDLENCFQQVIKEVEDR